MAAVASPNVSYFTAFCVSHIFITLPPEMAGSFIRFVATTLRIQIAHLHSAAGVRLITLNQLSSQFALISHGVDAAASRHLQVAAVFSSRHTGIRGGLCPSCAAANDGHRPPSIRVLLRMAGSPMIQGFKGQPNGCGKLAKSNLLQTDPPYLGARRREERSRSQAPGSRCCGISYSTRRIHGVTLTHIS
jgi:hypothetical protein